MKRVPEGIVARRTTSAPAGSSCPKFLLLKTGHVGVTTKSRSGKSQNNPHNIFSAQKSNRGLIDLQMHFPSLVITPTPIPVSAFSRDSACL